MNNKASKNNNERKASVKKSGSGVNTISYRLKCAKTANGLSHYVMYGDLDKKQALL